MLKPLSILLMLAVAAPVAAQTSTPAPSNPPAVSKDQDPSRIICEKVEVIGSRLAGKKVCMTAAQWQEQKARHREQVEKFQQQNTSTGIPGGGI